MFHDTKPFALAAIQGTVGPTRYAGTVIAVGLNSLSVTVQSGASRTFYLVPTTRYSYRGCLLTALPAFSVGLAVAITADQQPNGQFVARAVAVAYLLSSAERLPAEIGSGWENS